MSLFDRIFAAERGDQPAILFEQRVITYAELRTETLRVAGVLSGLRLEPGDRVALLLADSPEFVASFVAIVSCGAIAVPINPALSRDDQLFILNDCGARAVIIEAAFVPALFESAPVLIGLSNLVVAQRRSDLSISAVPGLSVQDFAAAPGISDVASVARAEATDDAFILFTSGSTGEPKGAVHTQAHILYTNETYCREVLKLRAGDRLFSSSRLPFAYGLGNAFTFPLLNGSTSILCAEKPAPEVIAEIFREYQPTIFFGVPVVYRMLLDYHRANGSLDTDSLRLCVSAGECLPAQLGQEWQDTFGVQVLDGIGSTEMLHMFMSNHDGDICYGSSGRLLAGYEARLVDHGGAAVSAGASGNLWIRGASAATRYWNRAETSAQTFVDGWVRTGDLYRQDDAGYWWHMGRSDDCFKSSGQWVSPIEVEGVLLRSQTIRTAAVVEGRDPDGLACVCAFAVKAPDFSEGDAELELRALCDSTLPRFKRPRHYRFVAELPYTATGKVQRFKLREMIRPKS